MPNFSNRELADIHFIYGFCNGNSTAAVEEYHRRYPQRRVPSCRTFATVHRNLVENGSFQRFRGQGRPMGNYDWEYVFDQFEENPQIATRPLAREINIPKSIVMIKGKQLLKKYFKYVNFVVDWKDGADTRVTSLSLSKSPGVKT